MTYRVGVKPELLRWARERADADIDSLVRKFPKYREWESGSVRPTYKQLEKYAKTVHAGIGFFFLSEPPKERFPIPDFRTIGDSPRWRPSINLLDTIYLCQRRQDWYREFSLAVGRDRLPFIGSENQVEDAEAVAARIRRTLDLDVEEYRTLPTWNEALRHCIKKTDALGVLVMVSSIVKNNTYRRLDSKEFRGFALADDLAPLIFINGADTKEAQMFALAHELAHLWVGITGFSEGISYAFSENPVENWCNRVAAELLVPLEIMAKEVRNGEEQFNVVANLEQRFRVSSLIAQRWIDCAGGLAREKFKPEFVKESELLQDKPKWSGSNFYTTLTTRLGYRFAHALVTDTLEGRTMFRDALRLLGLSKQRTFYNLASYLGIDHDLSS